jgi:nucleoside recognition membrane protein YjiH
LNKAKSTNSRSISWIVITKLGIYSLVGILFFFVPVKINQTSTILLDHIVSFLRGNYPESTALYAALIILLGGIFPFYKGTWRRSNTQTIFSLLKLGGIIIGLMAYFSVGPDFLFEKDMLPFLFNKLVIPVGLIVPIGAIFLAFLISYGLLELIGVLAQPIMRPLFKTPGKSAIDALASFVGSYSIGLLITNRVYKSGQYSAKEAAIIATGFSTVSVTFMVIVAKTLGLMDIWNLFFWSTLAITFVVTAITVRLPPLSKMDDGSSRLAHESFSHSRFRQALIKGYSVTRSAPPLALSIRRNVIEGLLMAMSILPSIMSVGFLGLVLAKFTPVFDWLGYLFYPFTALVQLPTPLDVARASATGLAEMFLPALLMADGAVAAKFVVGSVSISSILFFSASIPCILSTQIPLTIKQMLIIWYQRVALSIILAAPVAFYAGSLLRMT